MRTRLVVVGGALTLLSVGSASAAPARGSRDWPGLRGPRSDAAVQDSGLFDRITAPALSVAWDVPGGAGYSGVTVVGGRAFTAFAAGASDVVAAFESGSGREVWRTPLGPTYSGHDGSHDGPIATPAADADRVYALGPRGRLVALDARTGVVRWSQDLAQGKDAVRPYYGWSTSPLLAGRCVIVQHSVKGRQSAACYDRATGRARWTAGGSGEVWYQSPVLGTLGGREQVVAADQESVYGIDPADGTVLWTHAHGGDGRPIAVGSMVPLVIEGDRVLITPRDDSAVLLRVTPSKGPWKVETVWSTKGFRNSYSRPVYYRGLLFGYAGAFLACVDAATGEPRWRSRAPGDGFLAVVDGRLLVQTKIGSLHLAEASGEGYRELAQLQVFPDHSWTAPSVAAGRVFVRGMTRVASVSVVDAAGRDAAAAPELPLGPRLARFLDEVRRAPDKPAAVDAFLAGVESFPLVEADVVQFLYRGTGGDIGIVSDLIGSRAQRPLRRVEGTDLFYWSARARPQARLSYRFVRDFDENLADPRNPRREPGVADTSWFAMPAWSEPAFVRPAAGARRGRLEALEQDSAALGGRRKLEVWLPPTYDAGADRLPVAYVLGGKDAIEHGGLPNALDHLVGASAPAMIVVFVHPPPPLPRGTQPPDDQQQKLTRSLADEIVPFVDRTYRTRPERTARALVGGGFAGYEALDAAFRRPDLFARVSTQSAFMLTEGLDQLKALASAASSLPAVTLEWSTYDLRGEHEGWNNARSNQELGEFLRTRGAAVDTRVVHEGFTWGSWRNRADVVFGALFG